MKVIHILLVFCLLVLISGCLGGGETTTTTITEKTTTTIVVSTTTLKVTTTAPTTTTRVTTTTRPEATCFDGIKNQGEEDVDCGGPCKPCAIVADSPPELKSSDYWQYMVYDVEDDEFFWAKIRSYKGKTTVRDKEYDEFEIASADITENQEIKLVGTADSSLMYTEDNKVHLEREVMTSSSGSPAIFKYVPGIAELKFPLKIGEKWSGDSMMTWIYQSKSLLSLPINYSTTVVGTEEVTVKAGTFNTLKVVEISDIIRHGKLAVRKTTTRWYSPDIKDYVKVNEDQIIPGPSDSYLAQVKNVELTFGEYNITSELMLYSVS